MRLQVLNCAASDKPSLSLSLRGMQDTVFQFVNHHLQRLLKKVTSLELRQARGTIKSDRGLDKRNANCPPCLFQVSAEP